MPEKTRVFMVEGTGVNPIVSNFEVTVEKLVYGGDGLARLDGRVVLAPYVLPGERIRAEVERQKPGLVWARTLEVLERSSGRIEPACPVFGRCGGCHYQHAAYAGQVAAKAAILAEELRRVGKMEPPAQIATIAAEPWGYRNRVQLHVDGGKLGYRQARSHKLCEVGACPVASPKINQTIQTLNEMLRDRRWPRMVRTIELFTDERQVQLNVLETDRPVARRFFDWCGERIAGLVEGALDYEDRFRVSRNSFFQVNRFLADRLVEVALEGVEGESAFDLYAGVGLFAPAMAMKFQSVTAVESGSGATRDLQYNAERAGLGNIRVAQRTVEEFLQETERSTDFVLLDPPRAGLGKDVVRRLCELAPKQVAIVACDPATLARDLAGMVAGGYAVERLTMVDLFPQSYHVEAVVALKRR
jgi:23S rRNA (uracil1939-C5)-methyltransferase